MTVTTGGVVVAWLIAAVVTMRQSSVRMGVALVAGACVAAAAAFVEPLRVLLPAVLVQLVLLLPDGRYRRRAHSGVVIAGYVVCGAAAAIVAATGGGSGPTAIALATVGAAVAFPLAQARYSVTTGIARRQLQWVCWGLAVASVIALSAIVTRILAGWPRPLGPVLLAASLAVPVGIALGASRRRVGAIDELLAHTAAGAGLACVVLATYVLVVVGLGRPPTANERTILLLSMAGAALAALAYNPARRRFQRASSRFLYGVLEGHEDMVRSFGTHLSRAIPLDELLIQLADSLRGTLQLRSAEVWRNGGGVLERAASRPDRPVARVELAAAEESALSRAGISGAAWARVWLAAVLDGRDDGPLRVASITHAGELFGLILVDRAPGEEDFGPDDETLLVDLTRQVGLVLHNVRLDSALQASLDELRRQAAELQASRSRIVATADGERRRIERDLHDGAQQHLVAISMKLGLAKRLVERDVAALSAMLEELTSDVHEAVDELRRLAHGIYPPLLMERGLSAALTSAASRAALPTTVAADGIGRHAEEIEAAVYFCCLEALQNAGKHAGENASATVCLREEEAGLLFSVSDNGAGFDAAERGLGAGFINMRDRVGAIGGDLTVVSGKSEGTTISGRIPIQPKGSER
ncbi:MAG: sensor histidine kinase [Actinobacteria bacterium]|nr:sensor histidine kinase [Actinomycetota bacterium]